MYSSSLGQKSGMDLHGLKIKVSAGLCNQSGGARREFIFLPLQLLEASPIHSVMAPLSHFQCQKQWSNPAHLASRSPPAPLSLS